MNTASLELCKELFELSGWDRTDKSWWIEQWGNYDFEVGRYAHKQEEDDPLTIHFPAYDLGYLLRKLPSRTVLRESDGDWLAYVDSFSNNCNQEEHTPEDAAAKLCIELFKTGVLVKSE